MDLAERFFGGEQKRLLDAASQQVASKRKAGARRSRSRDGEVLETKSIEGLLWKAACSIRGEKDAPNFKDYILPLGFIKRLSDVFEWRQ